MEVDYVDLEYGPITLNSDLTINAISIDIAEDGVDGSITISDAAELTVNQEAGRRWTLAPAGTITYNGDAGVNTLPGRLRHPHLFMQTRAFAAANIDSDGTFFPSHADAVMTTALVFGSDIVFPRSGGTIGHYDGKSG